MTQFVLDSFEKALSSSIKTKIEEARQKFETEFVTSEFESLISTLSLKIDEIQCLLHEGLTAEDYFLISNKFQEACTFLISYIDIDACGISTYQEIQVFTKDFIDALIVQEISFRALGYISLSRTTKDEIDRYVHYIRTYQLFQELATNYWDNIPIEFREPLADKAYFLVKILLIPHTKILASRTSSFLSVFEQDKDLQILNKKPLENLSISVEESSKLNFSKEISNYLPELEKVVNIAVEQTRKWMELGIDISDPCLITPLEEMADNYPAIAEYCNDMLIELVKKQMNQMKNSFPDVNEEVLDEF
ncbi:hypothetical protein C7B67_06095 [filamentous cyanobacterium Phorm 6]|nr:hypothetical protein C7B67_06095 [filamentous cyanobacterium Phorm 6]